MSDMKSLENIFGFMHLLKRTMHAKVEELDLDLAPMHIRAMKIIEKHAPCTAVDIVNVLCRDKAQVTRLLKVLIDLELIEKQPNPEDKRSQFLVITDNGKAQMARFKEIEQEVIGQMTSGLSEQELDAFQAITQKMATNLGKGI
ncbi:MarR family transcriptional regulator [Vibrio sp. SCSIO 43136]|uniref:MarR family winged helix-turn-helix transcriptional regulator n=1 Tax=Vibrio sp. SCSIO 43136 TaxID=2819101 RepID=UPI00207552EB|nr:MarR family transcriptional regulator [Vibrio sp. SCSIO 43136]USD67536.1 MarR family transcriptional regulator [Vibrio sp. SCSIO 43136]